MANDNGNGDAIKIKLPDWVRYGFQYGLVGFIALVLLAAFLGIVDSPLTKAVTLLEAQARAIQKHDEESEEFRRAFYRALGYQNALLRSICYRLPSNERASCEPRSE